MFLKANMTLKNSGGFPPLEGWLRRDPDRRRRVGGADRGDRGGPPGRQAAGRPAEEQQPSETLHHR